MKIFLFYFEMAIKITGSAQNYRVGRVSGNTPIFRHKLYNSLQFKQYKYNPSICKELTNGDPERSLLDLCKSVSQMAFEH